MKPYMKPSKDINQERWLLIYERMLKQNWFDENKRIKEEYF